MSHTHTKVHQRQTELKTQLRQNLAAYDTAGCWTWLRVGEEFCNDLCEKNDGILVRLTASDAICQGLDQRDS